MKVVEVRVFSGAPTTLLKGAHSDTKVLQKQLVKKAMHHIGEHGFSLFRQHLGVD
jgi:hypothetical protein